MSNRFTFDDSDHLLFHGKAYLRAARLCLFQIIKKRYTWCEENKRVPDSFKPVNYTMDNLLPPALFCIQHGIEVCLKSNLLDLGIDIKLNHKTINLYQEVKKHVLETDWRSITINDWQVLIDQEEIGRIKNTVFNELDPLIEYFYYNDILHEKLGRPRKPDPNNEIFRYPQSISGDNYDIINLVEIMTEQDISELIRKLDQICDHLLDIGYLISETKSQRDNPSAIFG